MLRRWGVNDEGVSVEVDVVMVFVGQEWRFMMQAIGGNTGGVNTIS